jgi:multidrug efflux pump subunit AcrB
VRTLLTRRAIVPILGALVFVVAGAAFVFVGEDYFPTVDAGQIELHVRGRPGLRIEATDQLFQRVEDVIRKIIPDKDRGLMLDNIGLPANNYDLAFSDGSTVALNDGQILVSLKPGHAPTAKYQKELRVALRAAFPDAIFYFQPADIITQVLNFGLPAPIDVQVAGHDAAHNLAIAKQIEAKLRDVKGAADVHLQQIVDAPEFFVDVDRTRALELGLTEQQVANNVNVSLSSSFQVAPNFWTDPKNGIPYPLVVQTPEYRVNKMADLEDTPLLGGTHPDQTGTTNLLTNVATLKRGIQQTVISHSNIAPTYDIYANVQDRDLGGVADDIAPIVAQMQKQLKSGNTIEVRGQIQSMHEAFGRLAIGLVFAAVFIYLLMVVNFQTWIDPLVVLCALPLTVCGTTVMLFITGTTFSIPSLMGAIMAVGVASANSILLVTYARDQQLSGLSVVDAAMAAGRARIRPVLMTAGAMIVGLLPMAIGFGDGSEQNAALGRAVIGGLLVGTCATLIFVPYLYTFWRRLVPTRTAAQAEDAS